MLHEVQSGGCAILGILHACFAADHSLARMVGARDKHVSQLQTVFQVKTREIDLRSDYEGWSDMYRFGADATELHDLPMQLLMHPGE